MDYLSNPVFILGSPRSGTTFLGNCLSEASIISYHNEPLITKITAEFVYRKSVSYRISRLIYITVYSALFLLYYKPGRTFCEKTPRNCTIVPFLASTFLQSRFIHIVRDGRDAAVSHLKKPWLLEETNRLPIYHPYRYIFGSRPRYWVEEDRKREFYDTTDTHRVIWNWRIYNEMVLTASSRLSADRYLRIFYEDIAKDPDKVSRTILEFLEYDDQSAQSRLSTAFQKMKTDTIGQWKDSLSREQLETIYREAGPLLSRFNFLKCDTEA